MIKRLLHLPRRSKLLTLLLAVGFSSSTSMHARATTPGRSPSPAKAPAYEVISVKPSKANCDVMSFLARPGRLTIRCYPLRRLLFAAYSVGLDATIPGLPSWGDSASFDIEAKADELTTEAMKRLSEAEQQNQAQRMLKALLADRFKLIVHVETRERSVYHLIVKKSGFKLKPAHDDEEPGGSYSWGAGRILVRGGPIASLVYCLSEGLTGRPVVDKTGLTGSYDIDLTWTPDDQQGTAGGGPTVFTALEEQLGLKLVPSKAPVETFVVDHVERPSAN
jgi:uncharacterized protein (TIGR03435 family)